MIKRRERLIAKYLSSYISDSDLKVPAYFERTTRQVGKKLILASVNRRSRKVNFYIGSIRQMFDERLERIIAHELEHLKGANEKQAKAVEPKETPHE